MLKSAGEGRAGPAGDMRRSIFKNLMPIVLPTQHAGPSWREAGQRSPSFSIRWGQFLSAKIAQMVIIGFDPAEA